MLSVTGLCYMLCILQHFVVFFWGGGRFFSDTVYTVTRRNTATVYCLRHQNESSSTEATHLKWNGSLNYCTQIASSCSGRSLYIGSHLQNIMKHQVSCFVMYRAHCSCFTFLYIFIMLSYSKYTHKKEKVHKRKEKKKTINY